MDKAEIEEIVRKKASEKFIESIKNAGLEADPNCKREGCYGQGYTGRNIHTNLMKPCQCLRRNTKWNNKRSGCSHGR